VAGPAFRRHRFLSASKTRTDRRAGASVLILALFAGVAAIVVVSRFHDSAALLKTSPASSNTRLPLQRTAKVSLARLIGQTLMGRMTGEIPSRSLLARVRRGELGGIIIFSDNIGSVPSLRSAIDHLQRAAAIGGNPPLLIATDQEGGIVKRFPAGPPFVSPAVMGAKGSEAASRRSGDATAAFLRRTGINVDLAPVLDVPSSSASFLGSRAFSQNPAIVARVGSAFIRGLQRDTVAATAKHFPGLGTATANTDNGAVIITTSRAALVRRLVPFETAIARGVRLIMVSNASYLALDSSGASASLSRPIVTGLLRGDLHFGNVVITDAMSAPGPARYRDAPIRALHAGVDVLLYSDDEQASADAYSQVAAAARAGKLSRAILESSYERITKLKAWLRTG
jgi:beta-N-acetylhexosaminidase